jgi:hypothetical protein
MPEFKVPYQYVAELTPRAAQQLQRDFAELEAKIAELVALLADHEARLVVLEP